MMTDYGVGALGGVVLIDPETGLPYKAEGGGASELPISVPGDIDATGTPSATTYLRGDGSWTTPPNTTYSIISQVNAENPASTAAGTITGQRLAQGVAAYLTANPIPAELPTPPAEGTFNLQSVDGVVSWVEA